MSPQSHTETGVVDSAFDFQSICSPLLIIINNSNKHIYLKFSHVFSKLLPIQELVNSIDSGCNLSELKMEGYMGISCVLFSTQMSTGM